MSQIYTASRNSPLFNSAGFLAILAGSVPNITGSGTEYVMKPTGILYNEGDDYNPITGEFTPSVDGLYLINVQAGFADLVAANTNISIYLQKDGVNHTVLLAYDPFTTQAVNGVVYGASVLVSLIEDSDYRIMIQSSDNGVDNITLLGGNSPYITSFGAIKV